MIKPLNLRIIRLNNKHVLDYSSKKHFMKKTHIISLVFIALAITLFALSNKDISTYSDFDSSRQSEKDMKVVVYLSKDKDMTYDPTTDANFFSFYATDNKGEELQVVFNGSKPQDFERSESIVLTGRVHGDEFVASDMLLKCPSKYKDEEIYVKGKQS